MTDDELKEKLKDRELRLLRAWAALERIQKVLRKRTNPMAFTPSRKSFEEMGEIIAAGVEDEIARRDRRFVQLSATCREAFSWVGRAPRDEKEAAEMQEKKRALDHAMCGPGQCDESRGSHASPAVKVPARQVAGSRRHRLEPAKDRNCRAGRLEKYNTSRYISVDSITHCVMV